VSEDARTWGLRLLALGIAIGIWFNASLEDRLVSSEKVVEASISYNRPRGFVIVNPSAQSVYVRLSGSKKAIRRLNPYMVDVTVELTQRQEGTATITLDSSNVTAPDGMDVVSIEPATVHVDLEREVSQRLPVVAKVTGEPGGGAGVGEPEVFPNQVLVTGPESMLARVDHLSTEAISLDGRATTFEVSVPVVSPDPLLQIVQPSKVTVRVPLRMPELERTPAAKPRKDPS
jgi:YbbR domain-containing protein